ncbi:MULTISPECIES: glycogen biosynthesis protein GlgD [Bacillus]|uniref:glycogen biosynthesis protein GlgD n=1 Tax=Bacillus TaxID=1386 RepID=UPI000BB91717|nr:MULTISPECIES: glycogen biosynthesis protein GlgD [Bacillus]
MIKRSKQNNPEQKTKNGVNNVEMGQEYNPVKEVKQKNLKKAQPVRSKNHSENE